MDDPRDKLLLLAHPRSGSSNICEILNLHPRLRICVEPFNEHYVHWAPGNKNYRALVKDLTSLDEQLREIFATFNGLKLLNYQLPEELVVTLIQRPEFRVVFLRRCNLLQAVVSVLIAEQSGLWHRWDPAEPVEVRYARLRPLDINDVRARVLELSRHMRFLESVADERSDGRVLKLIYEDLFFASPSAQREAVRSLWRFLQLDPLESDQVDYYLRPEETRLNSPETYRLVPNAEEVDRACGSDETGWLFDEPAHRV